MGSSRVEGCSSRNHLVIETHANMSSQVDILGPNLTCLIVGHILGLGLACWPKTKPTYLNNAALALVELKLEAK